MQPMSAKITRFFARRDDDLDGLEIIDAHGPHMQKQQLMDAFLVPINRAQSSPLRTGQSRQSRRTSAQPPPPAAAPLIHGIDAADEREEDMDRRRAERARELRDRVKREERREQDDEDEDEDLPLIRLSRPSRPSRAPPLQQQQPSSPLSPPRAASLLAIPSSLSSPLSASAGRTHPAAPLSGLKAEEEEDADAPPPPSFSLVAPSTVRLPPPVNSAQQRISIAPLWTPLLRQSAAATTVCHAASSRIEAQQVAVKDEQDDAMPSLRLAAFTSRLSAAPTTPVAPLSPLSQNTPPRIGSAAELVQPSAPPPAFSTVIKQEDAVTAVLKENCRPSALSVAAEAAEERKTGWRDGSAGIPCSPPPLEPATQRLCALSPLAPLSPLSEPLSSGDDTAATTTVRRVKREAVPATATSPAARGVAALPPPSLSAARSRAPLSLPSRHRRVALTSAFCPAAEPPVASSSSSPSLPVPHPARYQNAPVPPADVDEDDGEPCSPIAESPRAASAAAAAALFAPPAGAAYTFKRLSELRGDDGIDYRNQFASQPAAAAAASGAASSSTSSSSARAASSSSSSSARRRVPDFVTASGSSGHWRSINGQKVFFTPSGERLTGSAAYLRAQKLKMSAAARGERPRDGKRKKRKTALQHGEEQEAAGGWRKAKRKGQPNSAVSSRKRSREEEVEMHEDEQKEERKEAASVGRARARKGGAATVRSRQQDGRAARAARAVDEDVSDAEAEWVPVSPQERRESSRASRGRAVESEQEDDIEDFAVDDDDDYV